MKPLSGGGDTPVDEGVEAVVGAGVPWTRGDTDEGLGGRTGREVGGLVRRGDRELGGGRMYHV